METALSERGYSLVDYADQGPGRGMEFEIAPLSEAGRARRHDKHVQS
jgi:hypothetical protein